MGEATKSLRAIFDEACEIEIEEERQAYLEQACGNDAALRTKIEKLLRSEVKAGGFLADPHRDESARLGPREGDQIGRYKLLQKIGEGGCGAVFMAEQSEPVRRRVALKIIKLGMDTRSVVTRFEAERQALALMDHPNIARVLDAGATDAGRPFFVMELVRGIKITDFCEQNQLSISQRLDLFIQVCQAVQHAHQKGIIHRDLKPSNVLVTSNDGVPLPKVIDFGIAKATADVQLTTKTLFTRFDMFIGTPAYMSPEQAELNAQDVDTRSDIYSLGVLLYELLTGHPPFDTDTWRASRIDSLRKAIREKEPTRPSARLTMELASAKTRASTPSDRPAPTKEWIAQLRGDLDWIVLKALEKDRTRRYQTANGLAADIQRHLKHEPVVARPPSPLYQFSKLVRRNRPAFAVASAVALLLVASVIFSVRDATRTRRVEKVQRELRETAETANRQLTHELFLREWQDAETLLEQGRISPALAWFARAARTHPGDFAVQTRLLSILTENTFVLPIGHPFLHGAPVRSGAFSADQQHLVTSTDDGKVRIWTMRTDAAPLILPYRFSSPSVTMASDDRIFVNDAESVSLWGLNGELIQRVPFPHPVGRLPAQATRDGRVVALNGGEEIWETAPLRLVHRPPLDSADSAGGLGLAGISPDGRYLFGQGPGERFSAWEVSTGRRVWEVESFGAEYIPDIDLAGDGRRIVLSHALSAGDKLSEWIFDPDAFLRVPTSKILPRALVPVRKQVRVLKFSPGGDRLFAGDLEGRIGTVDFATAELQLSNGEHEGRVTWMGISADGQRLATTSVDGTARLWDVRMKTPEPRLFTNGPSIWDARFSPDSRTFALTGADALEIRDSVSGALLHRLPMRRLITHVDFSPDGRRVVAVTDSGERRVWNAVTGEPLTPILQAEASHYVEFSGDGRQLLIVTRQATVTVHETETGRQVGPTLTNQANAVDAHFSPDGRLVVATPETGEIELWSWPEGRPLPPPRGHKDVIWSARFSPDGKKLLTASRDRTAALWELGTQRLVREFQHDQQVYDAAFSPDGRRIVTGDASRLAHVWDTETGRRLFDLLPHPGGVWYLEFSPDGRLLLTGDDAGNARLWEASSGLPLSGWIRNGRSLRRLRFSPHGRLILSASDSGTVRIWPVMVGPAPAPAWLPDLAEALAGRRLREDKAPEPVPDALWPKLTASLTALEGEDFYARWARWFLVERMKDQPSDFRP